MKGLYLITDNEILKNRNFYSEIENSLKGGVNILQLREKNTLGKEFLEKAIKLRELTRKYNATFIINDRVDIAILCEADGVHVGQDDISCKDVRKLLGKDKIIGVTVKTVEQAQIAEVDGATYIGVGDLFGSITKKDAIKVTVDTLKEIKQNVTIPIVGVGGLKLSNVDVLKPINIEAYGVISSILSSDNIEKECKKWIKKIKE